MSEARVTPFNSEAEYRAAIDGVIPLAEREICAFAGNLDVMALEDKARAALLEDFIAADHLRRLRVVVHDPLCLERSPRLQALLRRFPLSLEFRQSPEHLRHLADCLLLVDGCHGVIRFHGDHARGKLVLNDAVELAPRLLRFEDLWAVSHPCLWATQLGL